MNISRRAFATGTGAALLAGLAGCNSKQNSEKDSATTSAATKAAAEAKTLTVFAAASLTESLTAIGDAFKAQNDGVELAFTFDSSGTLATQIEEGAVCDIFISAAQKQMNKLDAESDSSDNEADLIDHATRVNLLENKVELCVPEANPKEIDSFDTMAKKLGEKSILLGMGNSDVPVGQYTQKILAFYNLDEKSLADAGCITYGSNVKEVTTQISEATVDCGVIYKTDATSAGLKMVDEATEDMCGKVVYPAAVTKNAAEPELATSFMSFLNTNDAATEFEKVGFTPLTQA